ncbi:hypothetical protein N8D77_13550 [Curtobacterium flaccumfaciens]|uniref:hypothetical protein n=1 Tax=Curtobacterium flaccumfaciens TaxID=2035 RepID=UPI0021C8A672|nr:hypothetical protein [Curtobacterium flaccumfaciens]UXN21168.1 hypothetical protein N8D77_13550 [Curtobacterium flaccumfaciens pv. flaccumfaciens]
MDSLVTMPDIARLANVTRQAVTNWRSRPAILPFPSPRRVIADVEHFDRDAVVDWLEATGRGLNENARIDAAAVAVPTDLNVDDAVVVLALRASAGQDVGPLSAKERVELARGIDPNDQFLLDEVTRLAENGDLAEYVDALHEASFGPSDALDRLYGSRAAQGSRGLAPAAVSLAQQLADACRTFLGPDGVAIELRLNPRDRAIGREFESASSQSDRAVLQIHSIDGVRAATTDGPVVKVFSLAGLDDAKVLDAAGDIAVELDTDQIAIVVGPASVLCDRLAGDLYVARKTAIQSGGEDYGCALVAAFKLPRGLWRDAHRQSLGLWVLRGSVAVTAAVVADLSGTQIDEAELASDTLGALEQTRARAYRYGRALPYNIVWTSDTVVPPGIGAQPSAAINASTAYDRLLSSTLVTREPVPGFDLTAVRDSTPGAVATRSLGDLIDAAAIRRESGSRIAEEDLDPEGTVPVIAAEGGEPRWIDRLVEARRYHSAGRTEPGDVVFSANPPRATVDEAGGAIVAFPSRILRPDLAEAGIGPQALAAVINRLEGNAEWKTWQIPRFPDAHVRRVEDAIAKASAHLAEVHKHKVATADLITSLIQGVAAGSVTLDTPDTEKKAGSHATA